MRRGSLLFFAVILAFDSALAAAGGDGRFTLPLPSADLPAGSLTVKVVGNDLRDLRVGQSVTLLRLPPTGDPTTLATATTGEDGRARFTGLRPGTRVVVQVKLAAGSEHRSDPFELPARGGIRLLLSLGDAPVGMTADGRLPQGHPPIPGGESDGPPDSGGAASIEPAGDLASGQVQVMVVKGQQRRPVTGATVTGWRRNGGAQHNLVTNNTGVALLRLPPEQVDGLEIRVTHDGMTYRSRPLTSPHDKGLRATFVVFDRTVDRADLTVAPGSHWVCQLGESVINVMQLLILQPRREVIFDPGKEGMSLPLPAGAVNLELAPELEGVLTDDRRDGGLRLRSPVPPGGVPLRFFYALPYEGGTAEFKQRAVLAFPKSSIAVLNNDEVELAGPSVGARLPRDRGQTGQAFSIEPTAAGSAIEFSFLKLPQRSRAPLFAVLALAGLIGLWGVLAALSGSRHARAAVEQREQLLRQLQQLRQAASRGKGSGGGAKDSEKQRELEQRLRRLWDESW